MVADPDITLARIGGDESIVPLKDVADTAAIALAERMIAVIALAGSLGMATIAE